MRVRGDNFVDEDGRTLMLRGVNLGGSSKVPFTPNGATHISGGFLDHRGISCPGRPGYLEYLRAVVGKANAFGMSICVDPHQDIGSRFSGGDGAPGWTLEARGIRFLPPGRDRSSDHSPGPWRPVPTDDLADERREARGGDEYAPCTVMHGERAQEFLQRHSIGAIARVAQRLADMPNLIGYGTMNEPLPGYIGCADLNRVWGQITFDDGPTPFEGVAGSAQGYRRRSAYGISETPASPSCCALTISRA
jgi:hypothetical protein